MTYQAAVDLLYQQLPMFQNLGKKAYKANLDNTIAMMNLLGNPQQNLKFIHIAGTNGKGSTSHMLSAILQQNKKLKVGLYTSPHLKDFRERIRINGQMISKRQVVKFITHVYPKLIPIKPSFFELTFAMAIYHFHQHDVDIAVIETGLGGRLDSTNIINPKIAVITNIGMDHTDILGNSLEAIAKEKAGIIKPNVPVVLGDIDESLLPIFKQKSEEANAPLFLANQKITVKTIAQKASHQIFQVIDKSSNSILYPSLAVDLLGDYQNKNLPAVLICAEMLSEFGITQGHVQKALANVCKTSGLQGRWQVLSKKPYIVCDTGHNADAFKILVKQIERTAYQQLHMVFGMVTDKDIHAILNLLPQNANYYFCKPNVARGLDANKLKEEATKYGLKGKVYKTVKRALASAKRKAAKTDMIFVGGSTFVVAEVI